MKRKRGERSVLPEGSNRAGGRTELTRALAKREQSPGSGQRNREDEHYRIEETEEDRADRE